jgi:predicted GIY-YIG superfamily endonuclease
MQKKKHIYIIFNKLLNLIKIGITDNIPRRIRQLECASGCKLELYYHTETLYHATKIEKSLHQYFSSNREEGEYFNILPEEAKSKLLFVMSNLTKIYGNNI